MKFMVFVNVILFFVVIYFPSLIITDYVNNWAVLVCTSRFWFNYRHIANVLSMYRTVKRLGIPDSNIILMLSDDVACDPRNRFPGTVYNNEQRIIDLYGGVDTIEVDYRGYEVTVQSFIRVLTGKHSDEVPKSKRLMTDENSNILIYMTGHGGDEFLKYFLPLIYFRFQDAEELTSYELADAFQQMYEQKRYGKIFFIIDTCQANTLYSKVNSPNILASGSSEKGENSYSHHMSSSLGVAVIDRFTYYFLDFMEKVVTDVDSKASLADLYKSSFGYHKLYSTYGIRTDLFPKSLDKVSHCTNQGSYNGLFWER